VRPTLDLDTARRRVLEDARPLPPVEAEVLAARGLALAETVIAREAMPPFDNAGMDGFAVRALDTAGASAERPAALRIAGRRFAGAGMAPTVAAGQAVRVMTGAPIPPGADAVVPIEHTDAWDGERGAARTAETDTVGVRRPAAAGDNVRPRGESVALGGVLLEAGHVLGAAEIGLLIAVGHLRVAVHPRPTVGVLSTGDEVVPPEAVPDPGEIRDSNRPALLAALEGDGFRALDLGLVRDDADALRDAVISATGRVDFLLTSGGVSVGDRDLTRHVLAELGAVEAYRVAVKPGMPQVYGRIHGVPVFGLPGNPVSSLVVFEEFVLPALRRMAGRREVLPPWFDARLAETVVRKPGRVELLRVRLTVEAGAWTARPSGGQGSGMLSAMTRANGYAILSADAERIEAGTVVSCRFRPGG
jgi:molybdopterin molybdotransferase